MLYENIREDMDDHELVAHGQIIKKPCLIVRYD